MQPTHRDIIDLAAEILNSVVAPLPVLDVHTHILPTQPSAGDLGEVLFYHYIVTELRAAGVSQERLEAAVSTPQKISLFAAEHHRISNTVTFWCLRQTLEALGLGADDCLNAESLSALDQNFRAASSKPGWPAEVLTERNRIAKTFLTLSITENLPSFDRNLFAGTLRVDDLLAGLSPAVLADLEHVSGFSISSIKSLERAAGERLTQFANAGGVAVTAGLPPEEEFSLSDGPEPEKLFDRVRKGESLDLAGRTMLHSTVLRTLVGLANELRLPVQLLLGVRASPAGRRQHSGYRSGSCSTLGSPFPQLRGCFFRHTPGHGPSFTGAYRGG